jgi:hypothetical protein
LDRIIAAVLILGAVELVPLPEEAADSSTTWILLIGIAMCDLDSPELNCSRDVDINRALHQQGSLVLC